MRSARPPLVWLMLSRALLVHPKCDIYLPFPRPSRGELTTVRSSLPLFTFSIKLALCPLCQVSLLSTHDRHFVTYLLKAQGSGRSSLVKLQFLSCRHSITHSLNSLFATSINSMDLNMFTVIQRSVSMIFGDSSMEGTASAQRVGAYLLFPFIIFYYADTRISVFNSSCLPRKLLPPVALASPPLLPLVLHPVQPQLLALPLFP